MLPILQNANLLLAFLLEVVVYLAVGYWGFTLRPELALKLLLGIGGPLVLAVIWGVFGSPKAFVPLHGLVRVGFEIVWFGAGAAALVAVGRVVPAVVFGALYIFNAILLRVWPA